jgi:hypothetical protein
MQGHVLKWSALALGLLAGVAGVWADSTDDAPSGLAEAVRKTAALGGYGFQIEEAPGQGTGGAFRGRHAMGQPVWFSADRIEFYRKGGVLAYKDGEHWRRGKTGTESDPLRVLGAAAKVRAARLPHEELPEVLKGLRGITKAADGSAGSTVRASYTGRLDEAVAQALTPAALRSVTRGGRAKVWVGADGLVHRYALTLRTQGRLGNADIDGEVVRTVTLDERGTARVRVPEEARKALERVRVRGGRWVARGGPRPALPRGTARGPRACRGRRIEQRMTKGPCSARWVTSLSVRCTSSAGPWRASGPGSRPPRWRRKGPLAAVTGPPCGRCGRAGND